VVSTTGCVPKYHHRRILRIFWRVDLHIRARAMENAPRRIPTLEFRALRTRSLLPSEARKIMKLPKGYIQAPARPVGQRPLPADRRVMLPSRGERLETGAKSIGVPVVKDGRNGTRPT